MDQSSRALSFVVLGALLVVLVGAAAYYFTRPPQAPMSSGIQEELPTPIVESDLTETATPTIINSTTTPSPSGAAGTGSYRDPEGRFTFSYDSEFKLEPLEGGRYLRLYKTGPTQRGQTEMYDGALIVMEPINLNGQKLEAWVDKTIADATANGMSEVTQPKKTTTLNDHPGFTYTLRGLGETTYTVIQKDANSSFAMSISTLVADPANQHFQADVDAVFKSLQLLK